MDLLAWISRGQDHYSGRGSKMGTSGSVGGVGPFPMEREGIRYVTEEWRPQKPVRELPPPETYSPGYDFSGASRRSSWAEAGGWRVGGGN